MVESAWLGVKDKMDILIKNSMIVTMNSKEEIIERGNIIISGRLIEYVGKNKISSEDRFEKIIDGSMMIAIPGLINAHTHSPANLFKGMFECLPLEIWRQYYRAVLRNRTEREHYISSMLGIIEMLKTGATTFLDHFHGTTPEKFNGANAIKESIIDSGIRGIIALTLSDKKYEETLPIKMDDLSENAKLELAKITESEMKDSPSEIEEFIKEFSQIHPRVGCMVGPSAPHRCSEKLLVLSKNLADKHDVGIHIHVAETKTQASSWKKKTGISLVTFLDKIGVLCDRLTMAHGVWIDGNDMDIIAKRGSSVVHNPASNLKLGSGLAPIREMLLRGINVAVATDGSTSNDNQNMFEAMRMTALIHNVKDTDYNRWIKSSEAFKMATINGAKACRLGSLVGSVEKGKLADIVLLEKNTYNMTPMNDIIKQLVFCENGSSVDTVIVDGEVVVEKNRLVYINENDIYEEARNTRSSIQEEVELEMRKTNLIEPKLREMYFEIMRNG